MTCGKYMDPKIIISKYNERVESLKEVEGFDMSKRESYSLSFFGKTIQKSKVIISLLLLQGLDKKHFSFNRSFDASKEFKFSEYELIHKYLDGSRASFDSNLLERDDLSSRLKSSLLTAHKILSSSHKNIKRRSD